MLDKTIYNDVVGNAQYADSDAGFKSEVRSIFEAYANEGVNLTDNIGSVISDAHLREDFIGSICESLAASPLFTNADAANAPFYNNYGARVEQLLSNTLKSVAAESVMYGYAPIVAYNPFFLKKQWIDCIFKDVLMTEIPKTPVINLGFERRYLKDLEGERYPLPEALYDDEIVKKLMDASTGLNLTEEAIDINDCKQLYLIDQKYIPGVNVNDKSVEITPNICVWKVMLAGADGDIELPVNMTVDVTTHNFINTAIKFDVKDETTGEVKETIEDQLVGHMNFRDAKLTLMSTTGKVTKVFLRGKIANRWNQRSLDVERTVEHIQKTMPESGPRLNSSITVEDAADALALQNIDQISDNINIMGATLANLEDAEINMFLKNSFEAQKKVAETGVLYNELGDNVMIAEGNFNTLPYETFNGRISEWQKDAREYFERMLSALKIKLRSQNMLFVAVSHPNTVRYLQDGINWVFSDDTQIGGVRLNYNFGIYTTAQDRVHIVTTQRMAESEGIRFIGIPLTQELITFKHYKYNVIIDRGYRNPLTPLTPNIMATQRTLTFEIFPVQGVMTIEGRELFSPDSLKRKTVTP